MSQLRTLHLLCDQNHYLPDSEPSPNDCDIHSKIYVDTKIEITQPKIIINSTKIGHYKNVTVLAHVFPISLRAVSATAFHF